ncbi:uncharacterized protein LOC134281560 [Saccostrea cucullata]|uniref:uncharacterized protein LOC134281560 n=1 Tax=Saccostrea cuccullata TaxID=36930 RepID=UPI002ED090EB
MRLPPIPRLDDPQCEPCVSHSDALYTDPDYISLGDESDKYEYLQDPEEGKRTESLTSSSSGGNRTRNLTRREDEESYVDQNDGDRIYLGVMHANNNPNDECVDHPYLGLVHETNTINDGEKEETNL